MATPNSNITHGVISEEDIRKNIGLIFPDTIILDKQYKIVSLSNNICASIGYHSKELIGSPISVLGNSANFKEQLEHKLLSGFFEEYVFGIRHKLGQTVAFGISGFYLGLIADISDYIILKFKNLDEVNFLKSKLEDKTLELDHFVYQSAHSLRGPLATLKGLINLLRSNPEDMDFLVGQMNVFANRLDDKLFQLMHFAESDKIQDFTDAGTLASITNQLQQFITIATANNTLAYNQTIPDSLRPLQHSALIFNLLQNITSFFCQQPRSAGSSLRLDASANNSLLEFELSFTGIKLSDALIEKVKTVNFGYVEILKEAEFTNLYAAKKIVGKLKGSLYFTIHHHNDILVNIIFPK